ncbi:hypothetical protein, partial [Endozoicomonas acroporae]|uniref:hypothetical protein n=1 Tax=Endozoicomonas acroporae TaxID=1701104 RepID=UPI003D7A0BF6
MSADRDVHILSTVDRELRATTTHQGYDIRDTTRQIGSTINTEGDLTITAGSDIAAIASKLVADEDIDLEAN